jgi:inner membrane protein
MATPIGHTLAGYAVWSMARQAAHREERGLAILSVLVAITPDLDFLPGLLVGTPALFHQGITHSLVFGLVVSLGAAGLYCLATGSARFRTAFSLAFLAYISHLFLDYAQPDGRAPYGIPALWPFSGEHFISPFPLLLGAHHAGSTSATTLEIVRGILVIHNLAAVTWEIVLVVPFILLGRWYRRHRLAREGSADGEVGQAFGESEADLLPGRDGR